MNAPGFPPSDLRPPLDLSLYLVTDTALCGNRGVAATVASAVGGGVTVVQLRDHDATDDDLVRLGRSVRAALAGTGVPLLVDDHVHLVEAIGADGAHVGQEDIPVAEARRMLGPARYLGLTARTLAHVGVAAANGLGVVDYLGVGPVWATTSKPGHAPAIGVEGVQVVAGAAPWPCVAIGGITPDRAPALRATEVQGIAVVSAICGAHDVAGAARALRSAWGDAATATCTPTQSREPR